MSEHEIALAEGDEAEQKGDLQTASAAYRRLSTSDVAGPAAQGLFRLGRVAWRQGRLDDALVELERARAAAIELGDDDLRAAIENGVGSVYCQRGIFTQARSSFAVASELAASPALRGRIQINMGALALLLGDVEEARESYERAVELLDSINDEEAHARAAQPRARALGGAGLGCGRGVVRAVLDDRGEARRQERDGGRDAQSGGAALRGGAISRGAGAQREVARDLRRAAGRERTRAALRVQGEIYRKMHQLEEAEPRLKEAIRIAGRLQLLTLEAEAARELGMVKAGRGDVTSATKWLRRALARFSLMSADDQMHAIEEQLQALKPWRPSGEQKTVKKG